MKCQLENQQPDWKAYALGELNPAQRREAEAHASSCEVCQQEWAALGATLQALAVLREEEIPRRIAFVSDKVFEPRWWQMFLRPSFAAAALVAGAITLHAFVGQPFVKQGEDPQAMEARLTSEITTRVTAEISQQVSQRVEREMAVRIDQATAQAVTKAVAEARSEDDKRNKVLMATMEQRYSDAAAMLNRQFTRIYAMNTGAGVR